MKSASRNKKKTRNDEHSVKAIYLNEVPKAVLTKQAP